jgi:hypothetical protein
MHPRDFFLVDDRGAVVMVGDGIARRAGFESVVKEGREVILPSILQFFCEKHNHISRSSRFLVC